MSECFPCVENKCQNTVEVNCEKKICNTCSDTYDSKCVFVTEKIMCTNGKLYIEAGTNLNNAMSQLICEIDRLKERVDYIMKTCCSENPTICEIPFFEKII